MARFLGPEKFGLLNYVLSFVSIFAGIAKLGLDGIMVRELVNHPEKRDAYLGTAFWLKIFGAILMMGIVATTIPFTNNDTTTNQFIFIIATSQIFQSFEVVQFYFQSQVLAKIVSICKVSQLLLSSIIKVYLLLTEAELIDFVIVAAFDGLSLAISYVIAYKLKINSSFYRCFEIQIARKLAREGWPLVFAGLGFTLFSNVDAIIIKEMIGEAAVGVYMAAYKLTVLWYFLPGLVLTSVMPAIVKLKDKELNYTRRINIVGGVLIWFAIVLASLISFYSEDIILYTFGNQYAESSNLLVLLIWINVIIFFNSHWNYIHMIEGKTRLAMYFHLLAALLNIALNFILIPIMGVVGAAYAILFSLLLSLVIFAMIDKKTVYYLYGSLLFWRELS